MKSFDPDNKSHISLTNIDDFDIDTHAVVEGSAGVGKTFTIKNIVLRLIEQGVDFNKILIVTFTEKATSELKEGLRAILEKNFNKSICIKTALENFDSAQIYTIHGFCRKILMEYTFENNCQFDQELINDTHIYKKFLHKQMRENWPNIYNKHLSDILYLSGL